jgi:protein-S-isoprenylcysteine O-methyltransferase Ste14
MTAIDLVPSRENIVWEWTIRISAALWYLFICATIVRGVISDFVTLEPLQIAQLLSKMCILAFTGQAAWLTIIRAQPIVRARGVQPRVSAFLGTNLVFFGILFLEPTPNLDIGFYVLSAIWLMAGNAFCAFTINHLGRSFSIMAEARKVVSTGPYAFVRHPLYLAELIAYIGILIQYWSISALILVIIQFGFQIKRMRNEEMLLCKTFDDYRYYMTRTARLIPGIW